MEDNKHQTVRCFRRCQPKRKAIRRGAWCRQCVVGFFSDDVVVVVGRKMRTRRFVFYIYTDQLPPFTLEEAATIGRVDRKWNKCRLWLFFFFQAFLFAVEIVESSVKDWATSVRRCSHTIWWWKSREYITQLLLRGHVIPFILLPCDCCIHWIYLVKSPLLFDRIHSWFISSTRQQLTLGYICRDLMRRKSNRLPSFTKLWPRLGSRKKKLAKIHPRLWETSIKLCASPKKKVLFRYGLQADVLYLFFLLFFDSIF